MKYSTYLVKACADNKGQLKDRERNKIITFHFMCYLNITAVNVMLRWRQGFKGKEKLGRGGGVQEGKEEYCREEERVKHGTRVWRKDSILSCLYELGTKA